ncbi:hypothetical protein BS17DRAFT_693578 [Gyrodon lividus]|nr:hypothetical protein BS17DRAFT_693578 [Gyrodon lividus]
MASIDSLLSLDIVSSYLPAYFLSDTPQIKSASLSFRSTKELRTCAEILPCGPQWVCETMQPAYPVKQLLCLFYRNAIDCLQALLSHPLFEPHISFVPWRVWTCAAKICCIYDEWLSGDCTWSIQEALPPGASVLGVVLSSDKTNISVMTGNCMAHPVLISLANIDVRIHSKMSLHAYLLLALIPIAEVMMSDPVGNLRYCFTPLALWIADMPEQSLLAAIGTKVSLITIAMSKNFGDAHHHPPHTVETTLTAIHAACSQPSPTDYKNFLKAMKSLRLNGVVEPFWATWALSGPSEFLHPEPLHHFA